MRRHTARVAAFYGAHPVHLLALLGCFALAGYAALQASANPAWPVMMVWFLAAIVGHDLVLFALYALVDRSLATADRRRSGTPLVPAVNHLRVPALGAGLLFLLFFPGIIEQGAETYVAATGQTQQPYLQRWLLLSAAMFGISALAYALRRRRATTPHRTAVKAAARAIRTSTEPGERILATARRSDGTPGAVATTRALYHPTAGTPPGWQRNGWEDLATISWQDGTGELMVTGLPGSGIAPTAFPLADPAQLCAVGHALITAAIIATHRVDLDATHRAVITVRKGPWSDRLVWAVNLDPGLDPDNPDVRTRIDTAITTIRTDLGLTGPHPHTGVG